MIGELLRRWALHPFLAPEEARAGAPDDRAPFQAHIALLDLFLSRRDEIVERIQAVLNAQRKPVEYRQDASLLSSDLEDCFFGLPDLAHSQSRLRGQLEDAHRASGFRPRVLPGLHNDLIDPAEMMIRAFHLWGRTRWPGRGGRVRYAQTLFNLYALRCLELLSVRLWDGDSSAAGDRLSQVQEVLDRLWRTAPPDQPALVRDARWLIQMAQSPATDELGPYFEVVKKTAETLALEDRLEVNKAGVRMAAGHLRSQTHYYATKKSVPLQDERLLSNIRNTNALDFALLVQELVPLLDAYEGAWRSGDDATRLELADAICQGISADPELFVNRIELLGAYSMIEELFITTDRDGMSVYTAMGERHVQLLRSYAERIARLSKPLWEDCPRFRPIAGTYSPYGALYGFSTDLVEHMALKTALPGAVYPFGLEDVFTGGDAGSGKLAWVNSWRQLPHVAPEVQKLFAYPQGFAEAVFDRVTQALRRRVLDDEHTVAQTGRLVVVTGDGAAADPDVSLVPDLPTEYIGSSDAQLVAARKAHARDESQILSDRREARCLVSYKTPDGWMAIAKAALTEVLGRGRDVKIAGLSPAAAGVLKLMCRDLVM